MRKPLSLLLLGVLPLTACAAGTDPARVHELRPEDLCEPGQLRLEAAGGREARGMGAADFALVNEGSRRCVLHGFPEVEPQDGEGEEVDDVDVEEATGTFFEATAEPRPVTLAPGGRARFQLTFATAPRGGDDADDCPAIRRLSVELPSLPGFAAEGGDAEDPAAPGGGAPGRAEPDGRFLLPVDLRACDGYLTVGALRPA